MMKRWPIFGALKTQPAKPDPSGAAPPRNSDWTSMFKVRKKAETGDDDRAAAREPTSIS